jgi:hypothetical protein
MRFLWLEHGERDLRNGGLEGPPKRRGDTPQKRRKSGLDLSTGVAEIRHRHTTRRHRERRALSLSLPLDTVILGHEVFLSLAFGCL